MHDDPLVVGGHDEGVVAAVIGVGPDPRDRGPRVLGQDGVLDLSRCLVGDGVPTMTPPAVCVGEVVGAGDGEGLVEMDGEVLAVGGVDVGVIAAVGVLPDPPDGRVGVLGQDRVLDLGGGVIRDLSVVVAVPPVPPVVARTVGVRIVRLGRRGLRGRRRGRRGQRRGGAASSGRVGAQRAGQDRPGQEPGADQCSGGAAAKLPSATLLWPTSPARNRYTPRSGAVLPVSVLLVRSPVAELVLTPADTKIQLSPALLCLSTLGSPHGVRNSSQNRVDGIACPVVRVRPEMGVHVECLCGR